MHIVTLSSANLFYMQQQAVKAGKGNKNLGMRALTVYNLVGLPPAAF